MSSFQSFAKSKHIHPSKGKQSILFFTDLLSMKSTHTLVQLAMPVTGLYMMIAVHVTLAHRVLHPSLTNNVDVRIIVCTHVKR